MPARRSLTLRRGAHAVHRQRLAPLSVRCCEESRRFHERERAEGKRHTQAVLALARQRVNVIWALLRDQRRYQPTPPQALAA